MAFDNHHPLVPGKTDLTLSAPEPAIGPSHERVSLARGDLGDERKRELLQRNGIPTVAELSDGPAEPVETDPIGGGRFGTAKGDSFGSGQWFAELVQQRGDMAKAKRPTDRGIQRTRKLLQDALVAMMIEKGLEATTVQDIIDQANVGRATFYAHFADKETLLASRLEDLRARLTERLKQAPGGLGFSLAMLEHAREHLPLYSAIVGRESGAFVLQRIHRMFGGSRRTGPQGPRLQGHGRAARPGGGVHCRRLHGSC
jgi:tetracycline repressor-like protein